MAIRLIDVGFTSGIRSQTIYHGLGYAFTENTPNTIVFAQPSDPYMCIGFFQDVDHEIEVEYCKKNGLPIIRRETGGGTVYIDKNQLFVQWIFEKGKMPPKITDRFEWFVKPIIATYKRFGIDAYYYPINDVHVNGKKIVGTGAGGIGEAEIITGNFIFDFDYQAMTKALKVPDEQYRESFGEELSQYLTTINREIIGGVDVHLLKEVYLKECSKLLSDTIEHGDFTSDELNKIEELDKTMLTEEWLYQVKKPKSESRMTKIHAGVWLAKIDHKSADGEVKVSVKLIDEKIDHMEMWGNFTQLPDFSLNDFSSRMEGVHLNEREIRDSVNDFLGDSSLKSLGFSKEDWMSTFLKIKDMRMSIS